jgi:hypothetical protein
MQTLVLAPHNESGGSPESLCSTLDGEGKAELTGPPAAKSKSHFDGSTSASPHVHGAWLSGREAQGGVRWAINPKAGRNRVFLDRVQSLAAVRGLADTNRTITHLAHTQLPRRRYFPQPGVVANATTPGSHPHHAPYPVRIAFHPRLRIAARSLSEPKTKGTTFRVQGLKEITIPG